MRTSNPSRLSVDRLNTKPLENEGLVPPAPRIIPAIDDVAGAVLVLTKRCRPLGLLEVEEAAFLCDLAVCVSLSVAGSVGVVGEGKGIVASRLRDETMR